MSKYSEPWYIDPDVPNLVHDDTGQVVAARDERMYITKQQLARIVACVNACEGMDDPAKEIAQLKKAFMLLMSGGLVEE